MSSEGVSVIGRGQPNDSCFFVASPECLRFFAGMARRSRIEYSGAIYHVINRGNYRSFIFETAGARRSFLECLDTCCASQGWILHAWVLMGNHYHLCVETPNPNLVEGMKWLGFEKMCRGWIKGGKEFREAVLADLKDQVSVRVSEAEAAEIREPRWRRATADLLSFMGKTEADLRSSAKSAAWKVAMARLLRERYLAPNRWIAEHLHMGRVSTVQSAVSRFRTNGGPAEKFWEKLKKHETLG